MARQPSTRGTGSRLGRTETVSIRIDPRLNYLCELAARSQRRTKSSFIEATIAEKIDTMPISNWRDKNEPDTIGDRADYLWHVRECQRLVSLGFIAPHLMTFEEQQIWAAITESGHFWRGHWNNNEWTWRCNEESIIRDRVDKNWSILEAIGNGERDANDLPAVALEKEQNTATDELDDDIPF